MAVDLAVAEGIATITLNRPQALNAISNQYIRVAGDLSRAQLAELSRTLGEQLAVAQQDLKRLLSFTLVSHIGYMVWGVAMSSQAGLSAAIFYVVHHITVQTALFLVAGLIERRGGTTSLARLGSLLFAVMVSGFVLLLHLPRVIGAPSNRGEWTMLVMASLISADRAEHDQFYAAVDAPFVGNGFTRWVDGQYALDRPELGLSNWQHGRLLGRSGVLSGDSVFTVRTRAVQDVLDIGR